MIGNDQLDLEDSQNSLQAEQNGCHDGDRRG